MKTTAFLMDEHKHILRALYVLEQMALCAHEGKPIDSDDVEHLLKFLRVFADEHHQGKEETILFPAMLGASKPVQKVSLNHMIFEHDQERSLVEGLEEAVRAKKGQDFVYFAQRLVGILRTHIYKEDNILFEMADETLSKEEDAKAAKDLYDYDSAWRASSLNELMQQLHRLEWKYLGKTGDLPDTGEIYARRH